MSKCVCVVGGTNVDITGIPENDFIIGDSNPGRIRTAAGGVGRNIAENLARMGFDVELITPLGNDTFVPFLEEGCQSVGVSLAHAPRLPLRSNLYLCIMDDAGDMHAAISDMALCEAITPDMVDMNILNLADAILIDANLPFPVLEHISKEALVPIFADPVSSYKAQRLKPLLASLAMAKPNLVEARTLTGEGEPMRCARALHSMGVERVFVSAGVQGIYYCGPEEEGHVQPAITPVVNATGAGDSATAAIAAACLLGWPMEYAARLACRVAAMTMQHPSAVNPALSPDILKPEQHV